jgi:probable phosphoglycerate mutase
MMRLLLWRHGRTSWNDNGRFQGHADPPLDDTGAHQARLAGPVVAAMAPEVVVTSDLQRCTATAEALGLPVRVDARLREISLGEWSGLTAAEAARRFPAEDAAWRQGGDVRRGGGETYAEVAVRARAVLDELLAEGLPAHPDGLVVFVLHGGTARAIIGSLLALPSDVWWRFGPLGNCRWSLLRRSGGDFRLVEHNVGMAAVSVSAANVPQTADALAATTATTIGEAVTSTTGVAATSTTGVAATSGPAVATPVGAASLPGVPGTPSLPAVPGMPGMPGANGASAETAMLGQPTSTEPTAPDVDPVHSPQS